MAPKRKAPQKKKVVEDHEDTVEAEVKEPQEENGSKEEVEAAEPPKKAAKTDVDESASASTRQTRSGSKGAAKKPESKGTAKKPVSKGSAPKKGSKAKGSGKKDEDDVVTRFNEYVNMSVEELEEWLGSDESKEAGWQGDNTSGETKGHESGRQIVEILKSNPDKDASKYSEDDLAHMRRVVAYCKRHLAQEDKMKESKTAEELEKTKSTKSLKNWGVSFVRQYGHF